MVDLWACGNYVKVIVFTETFRYFVISNHFILKKLLLLLLKWFFEVHFNINLSSQITTWFRNVFKVIIHNLWNWKITWNETLLNKTFKFIFHFSFVNYSVGLYSIGLKFVDLVFGAEQSTFVNLTNNESFNALKKIC